MYLGIYYEIDLFYNKFLYRYHLHYDELFESDWIHV